MDLAVTVGAAQPNTQPLDLPPAVVDEMQPGPAGIGRQTADDDLASVHAQGSPLVRELTPDLLRKGAGICGFFARVLRSPDPDRDGKSRGRRRDDLEQEVTTGEQI